MIRRAVPEDIPEIMELLKQVLNVHAQGRPDIFRENGTKYSEEELAAIISDDGTPVFVYADDSGKVLGHCFCQIRERQGSGALRPSRTLFIDDLCVDENSRRRGIGRALYAYVKEFAAANGFSAVTLHVWACNPGAVDFYRSLGMREQRITMEEIIAPECGETPAAGR